VTARASVEGAGPAHGERSRDGGHHRDRHHQDPQAGELDLSGLDLFAQALSGSAYH
jgi:hypothetical protein